MRALVWLVLVGCSFEHGELGPGSIETMLDAAIDAPPDGEIDAALACPREYTMTLASSTTRYRVIATAASFAAHHARCNSDGSGTHLASLETATEIMELRDALATVTATQYYVGAVQEPNASSTTAQWFVFSGAPLPTGFFGNSNDDDPGENNQENLAALNTSDFFHDVTGDVAYPAVCECDGMAIDPTVAAFIP